MKKLLPNLINKPLFVIVFLSILFVNGCKKDNPEVFTSRLTKDFNGKVILQWNNLFLEIERYAQGFRPCPTPRALAYIGLACYEACVIDMPAYKSQLMIHHIHLSSSFRYNLLSKLFRNG